MTDRVLAFGCHPDDAEFMAAGTLALLAARGFEVHMATMAGGEVGSATLTSEEIHETRMREAAEAARVLGGRFHWAGARDLEVEYNSFCRSAATRVMREVDPLIVLAPPPMDYLVDHEVTSLLVRNAAYIASVPLYDTGGVRHTKRFPYLYYWNAAGLVDIFGRPLPVRFGVDTSSVFATKERMLVCHASQRDWLRAHNGWDSYVGIMTEWSKRQGELIARPHGECFIQHLGNGHPTDNILATVLGDLCVEVRSADAAGPA
jgi:N-acetylglucosamine malate deacetylase 1